MLVAKGTRTNLLGIDWFRPLGIAVTGVFHVQQWTVDTVLSEFSEVFEEGLGNYLGPPVSLYLDPSPPPVRLKARRLPFALQPKVEEELDRLVQEGVLEHVTQPTWKTPIVTVLKSNDDVRICGDYKSTVNKALKQHPYPIPAVTHLLSSLSGGKFFAKLDLAQAYQQLSVDEATADAQTIATHRGAYKVKRLQYGVSSAPGIFQMFMDGLLKDISETVPYFEDILIAAPTQEKLATLTAVYESYVE